MFMVLPFRNILSSVGKRSVIKNNYNSISKMPLCSDYPF